MLSVVCISLRKMISFNCVGNTFDSEITDDKKYRSAQALRTNAFFGKFSRNCQGSHDFCPMSGIVIAQVVIINTSFYELWQ